jgi:hypothetical protein
MRNAAVTIGSMILAVPITILVIWVGVALLGAMLRMLVVGAPIVLIGGIVLFLYQMFVKE